MAKVAIAKVGDVVVRNKDGLTGTVFKILERSVLVEYTLPNGSEDRTVIAHENYTIEKQKVS